MHTHTHTLKDWSLCYIHCTSFVVVFVVVVVIAVVVVVVVVVVAVVTMALGSEKPPLNPMSQAPTP